MNVRYSQKRPDCVLLIRQTFLSFLLLCRYGLGVKRSVHCQMLSDAFRKEIVKGKHAFL